MKDALIAYKCGTCASSPNYSRLCGGCTKNKKTIEDADEELKRLTSLIQIISDLTSLEK